jgi:hypothetical protein
MSAAISATARAPANEGAKVMTLMSAIALGADCIDDCALLRAGRTAGVLGDSASRRTWVRSSPALKRRHRRRRKRGAVGVDVPERERPQNRAQRRGRHHPGVANRAERRTRRTTRYRAVIASLLE